MNPTRPRRKMELEARRIAWRAFRLSREGARTERRTLDALLEELELGFCARWPMRLVRRAVAAALASRPEIMAICDRAFEAFALRVRFAAILAQSAGSGASQRS